MSQKGQLKGLDCSTWRDLERGPDPCLQIAKDSHGAKRTDVFCVRHERGELRSQEELQEHRFSSQASQDRPQQDWMASSRGAEGEGSLVDFLGSLFSMQGRNVR